MQTTNQNTIQLKRQGVGGTLLARFGDFHIQLDTYLVTIDRAEDPVNSLRWRNVCRQKVSSHEEAKAVALRVLRNSSGNSEIQFSNFVEAYMYYSDNALRIWPHIATDKYVSCAVYEESTDTIRITPQNYCLIHWDSSRNPVFDMDGATLPYREIAKRAHDEFSKPHNRRNSDRENKSWLAWLISEYIRREFPEQKTVVADDFCRRLQKAA